MTPYECIKIDLELRQFASKNFEIPTKCRNKAQIMFYSNELSSKIEEYQERFNYVPSWAYTLLEEYNNSENQPSDLSHKSLYP